jgi:hypothetical protein
MIEKIDLFAMYARRIIIEKPEDPISFLIDSISQDPFVPASANASSNEEKRS